MFHIKGQIQILNQRYSQNAYDFNGILETVLRNCASEVATILARQFQVSCKKLKYRLSRFSLENSSNTTQKHINCSIIEYMENHKLRETMFVLTTEIHCKSPFLRNSTRSRKMLQLIFPKHWATYGAQPF